MGNGLRDLAGRAVRLLLKQNGLTGTRALTFRCSAASPELVLSGRPRSRPVCLLSDNSGQTCSRGFDRIGRE